jgi:two-component system response regulator HydG
MKLDDLDLRDLLAFEPKGGVVRFAGDRALILDAVALGVLRKTLIDTLGERGARGVLTRFGFTHGQRTAIAMRTAFPWDDERDWRRAGGRLHQLQGLVVPETWPDSPHFVEALWHDSYEAEQHLIHVGRCDHPVCWAQCGFTTGYLSYVNQREIYALEVRCRGRGDAVCHMIAKPREAWGDALAEHLPYYAGSGAGLDPALASAAAALKATEQRLRRQQRALAAAAAPPDDATARSPAMQRALAIAARVAQVDTTVLITGESGVGKERMARQIHEQSARAARPLVAINCGAMPEGLLDSELFGHQKGAFTGASQDRPGLFEAASGGTLFLDEIGEVGPAMQVKLLRALQEREVRRLGEQLARKVDVRIIAATNRDLAAEVAAGRFREDLYYRLRVVELAVPPLRARPEDLVPLARALLAAVVTRTHARVTGFTPAAVAQLTRYRWPGNVRELENAIERAAVLASGGQIDVDDLPAEVTAAAAPAWRPDDHRTLAAIEREYIEAVVRAAGGHRAQAAAQLGIGVATLYRKLAAYRAADRAPARRRKPR